MLRFHKIPFYDGQFSWEISRINGCLLRSERFLNYKPNYSQNINEALHLINHPYEIQWNSFPLEIKLEKVSVKKIENNNNRLFKIGNNNFLLSILYSTISRYHFDTTHEAFSYISNLKEHVYGSENCFQRCLLAAKTSKSFRSNGIIFIGAEISTGNMHAWIIEKTSQPDFADRVWINYRPLLAITF